MYFTWYFYLLWSTFSQVLALLHEYFVRNVYFLAAIFVWVMNEDHCLGHSLWPTDFSLKDEGVCQKLNNTRTTFTFEVSWGRTSFFLAVFLVAFSGTFASLTASACRLFLAVLCSAVAENTAAPRSNSASAEVRFGVRGLEGDSSVVLLVVSPSFSPTASSITRTNSSWMEEEQSKASLFIEDLDLVVAAETRLRCFAGLSGPAMPFLLWEKKSVTRAWDMLLPMENTKKNCTNLLRTEVGKDINSVHQQQPSRHVHVPQEEEKNFRAKPTKPRPIRFTS